jgi:NB-ARC domain/TIR domain
MAGSSTKPSIFISYAHEDEPEAVVGDAMKWLSFVTGYLEPAVTQGLADLWIDNLMRGGDYWDREIKKLEACDVFILLVSRHSLASPYILKTEIATIKQRQQNKEDVHGYPLLLTTTPKYALDPVRDWNIRPPNLKPFGSYPPAEREEQMAKAADEIIGIAAEIAQRKARQPSPPPPPPPAAALAAAPERVGAESPVKASVTLARHPRNLPFATIGSLFVGREPALTALSAALAGKPSAGVALHGLGGVGKTRLAIEYALLHAADYSALLFVRADDPATLNANLAALAGAEVLDLPEKEARDDASKVEAVLRWLEAHPTWLLILDNVDDAGAVAAVTKLMPRLTNGHVIVTARATIFPAGLRKLEVDLLDEDSATRLLIERTHDDRARAPDDEAQAREIACEFDGLALGLEQAGAYIATEKIGFARYLKLWKESRDKVGLVSDRLGKDAGDGLGDLRRAPDARKPPPARPPCHACAGPDSRFAARRRRSGRGGALRRLCGARWPVRLFARDARQERGRHRGGFHRASPRAGFRLPGDDGRAARRGAAGGVGVVQ